MVEKSFDSVDHWRLCLRRGLSGCTPVYPRPISGVEHNSKPFE